MDNRKINDLIRENNIIKFYQSKSWRNLRIKILKRDNNECQECKRNGKVGKAENVHHIKEVKKFPELALLESNCECLCIPCHNEEHDRLKGLHKSKFKNDERW